MKETSYAYVAGLVDADGSIYISKSVRKDGYTSFDPIVMVRSTHLPTVKRLVEMFGGSYDTTEYIDSTYKTYYRWKFTSDVHAARFLEKILPYIWIKKKQALLLQEYYSMDGAIDKDKRDSLYTEVSRLNNNSSLTTNTSRLSLKKNIRQAYIAGMFDGEGSFYIIKAKQSKKSRCKGVFYRAGVSLGITCKTITSELQDMYGGTVRTRPPHNGILPMSEWEIKDNKSKETFLLSVLPYLVTKAKQANIILNFVRLNGKPDPEARKAMWLKCSELNGKKIESDLMGDHKSVVMVT